MTGDTIAVSPPLIIEKTQIDQLIGTVERAVQRVGDAPAPLGPEYGDQPGSTPAGVCVAVVGAPTGSGEAPATPLPAGSAPGAGGASVGSPASIERAGMTDAPSSIENTARSFFRRAR